MGPAKTLFLDEISTGQLPVRLRACVVCRCPVKDVSIFIELTRITGVRALRKLLTMQGWTLAQHTSL